MDATEWRRMFAVLPRRVCGRIVWLKVIQYRVVFPHGAAGILIGSQRTEYRLEPEDAA